MEKGDALRPRPPASATFTHDYDEVQRLDGRHSTERSPSQTAVALL